MNKKSKRNNWTLKKSRTELQLDPLQTIQNGMVL